MDLERYISRHRAVEVELKMATSEAQKLAAKHLLEILSIVKSANNVPINITEFRIQREFTRMYESVNDYIIDFGEDVTIGSTKFESLMLGIEMDNYNDIMLALFGTTLVDKHSLKRWLSKAAFVDSGKIVGLVKKSIIEEKSKSELSKEVMEYYKNPLNKIRGLMDAVAFSAVFLVRDKALKIANVKLMQWISILDKGTTPGCRERDSLVWTVENKKPIGHSVSWKEPGVYHWNCRSFVIPYKNK